MINGIWDNKYVQELGIIDHCHELIELKNKIREIKAYRSLVSKESIIEDVQHSMDNEIMDMLLILEKWAEDRTDLKVKRENRFREKAVSEQNI